MEIRSRESGLQLELELPGKQTTKRFIHGLHTKQRSKAQGARTEEAR